MNATSSQDEFAKWAKLRRQYDKAAADYEAKCRLLTTLSSSWVFQRGWGGRHLHSVSTEIDLLDVIATMG